ncbi:MAG: right-handed parallel beta-helix repeat-containing protein, partial [Bdellovibrionia bacterium]
MGRSPVVFSRLSLVALVALCGCLDFGGGGGGTSSQPSVGQPPQTNIVVPECIAGRVVLQKSDGNETNFLTVQAAINVAGVGDKVYVGPGRWDEIVNVSSKRNVELRSECRSILKGVVFSKSKAVTLHGFLIDANQTLGSGLMFAGGEEANSEITTSHNEVYAAGSDYAGIWIENKNSDLNFSENYIHDNLGDGFRLNANGGLHTLERNIIHSNAANGIRLSGHHTMLLKSNRIIGNGTNSSAGARDRYGIRVTASHDPKDITLIDNVIAYNNGKVMENSNGNGKCKGISSKPKDDKDPPSNDDDKDKNEDANGNGYANGHDKDKDKDSPPENDEKDKNEDANGNGYANGHDKDKDKGDKDDECTDVADLQKASADLADLAYLIDSTDTGNRTTTGSEGPGFSKLVDTSFPIISTSPVTTPTSIKMFEIFVTIDDDSLVSTNVFRDGNQTSSTERFSFSISGLLNEGNNNFEIKSTDAQGNQSVRQVSIVLDTIAPQISTTLSDNILTNNPQFLLPITIVDATSVTSEVFLNGVKVLDRSTPTFSALLTLTEGLNSIEVRAKDAAGNTAVPLKLQQITLDTIPPVLSGLVPPSGTEVNSLSFTVSGTSNEALSQVSLNSFSVALNSNKKSFGGVYNATSEGDLDLQWEATDLAGNTSVVVVPIEIVLRALRAELLSVEPAIDGNHLVIRGAIGAARPGITVTASAGFFSFNTGSVTVNADGSFEIQMDIFSTATVKATFGSRTDTAVVSFNIDTRLVGSVRDTNDNPLPQAKVSISGTNLSTFTNEHGTFVFSQPVTGDQVLIVDGTTIPNSITGPDRRYSKTSISISIGVSQSNVLQRPIYLAPLLKDGTETVININVSNVVTSPNAPGVELEIPANTAVFPNGATDLSINMAIVPSDRTTIPVPDFAVPTTVIALEPSGLTFTEPVPLTIPNENELPPGVEFVILSMNSKSGLWEIGATAKVSDDGRSVVTKPGQGITHFSDHYAIPLGPVIAQIGSQDKPGADTFNGSLTTSVSLPSFTSLGNNITPSLIYKSAWAKPTALVSNLFDVPEQKVEGTETATGSMRIAHQVCFITCKDIEEYLDFDVTEDYKAWYDLDFITAQFSTTGIFSDVMKFTGSPRRAAISYAFDLKNPTTGEYLNSGVYPYLAHYEVHLKHLIFRTRTINVRSNLRDPMPTVENFNYEIEHVFPNDLGGPIYVQNEINSPAGQGWRIAGVQKISNPDGNRVIVEEPDGDMSVYLINNTISTVYNAGTSGDLTFGADLAQYPNLAITAKPPSSQQLAVGLLNIGTGQLNLSNTISNYTSQLQQESNFYFEQQRSCIFLPCTGSFVERKWVRRFYNLDVATKPGQILKLPDGSAFLTDTNSHRILKMNPNGSITQLGGRRNIGLDTSSATPGGNVDDVFTFNQAMQNFCQSSSGGNCGPTTSVDCRYMYGANPEAPFTSSGDFGPGNFTNWCNPRNTAGQTGGGLATFSGDGQNTNLGLNSPLGAALSPSGKIVIADTGNNRVRMYDPITGIVTTIAGNGQTFDNGDGGQATQASLFHPRFLTFDTLGNLYITTERGFIRMVNPLGVITTFAGLPPSHPDAVFADLAPASRVSLNFPSGMTIDESHGYLYVADTNHHRIVRISFDTQAAVTIAGSGACVSGTEVGDFGPAVQATLCNPRFVGLDSDSSLLIADSGHNSLRKVAFGAETQGVISYTPVSQDLSSLRRNADGTWLRKYRNGHAIHYNSLGLETSATDRVGRTVTFDYDSNARLIEITDPVGQKIEYSYSGDILDSIKDPAGRITKFFFTGDLLSEVKFPDNTTRKFTYTDDGLLTSETNQRNISTSYTYNEWNRLATIVKPDGTTEIINDRGSATAGNNYVGNNIGQLKSIAPGEGQVLDGIVDAKGNSTEFDSNIKGFVTKIVDADGNVTKIERGRDPLMRPTKITRPDGTMVNYVYDQATFDALSIEDTALGRKISYTYNSFGNILTEKNSDGFISTRTYNSLTGVVSQSTTFDGTISAYVYNLLGEPTTITTHHPSNPNSKSIATYTYDSLGHTTAQTDGSDRQLINTFDLAGNLTKTSRKRSSSTFVDTSYTYDIFNRLTSVKSAGNKITSYTYLASGELSKMTDPSGNETTFGYNSLSQVTSKTNPLGFETLYAYDENGNLTYEKDANGNEKTFEYDRLNRITKKILPDNIYTMAYDIRGKVASLTNNSSLVSFQYDPAGRVLQANRKGLNSLASVPEISINYVYDANGNRTSMSDSLGGHVGYVYDQMNRLRRLTNHRNEIFNFTTDSLGRLAQIQRPGSITNLTYDAGNALATISHEVGGTIKSSFQYQNDGLLNSTLIRTPAGDHNLSYDNDGQLLSVSHPTVGYSSFQNEVFGYDNLGNRVADAFGVLTYDAKKQRLVQDYDYQYIYDNNGNLILKQPHSPD